MTYYTYILLCSDGSFYVGYSADLLERLRRHNLGEGAQYTKRRRPVGLAYFEKFPRQETAMQREQQLKKWSHAKKKALILEDFNHLHALAKRHGH